MNDDVAQHAATAAVGSDLPYSAFTIFWLAMVVVFGSLYIYENAGAWWTSVERLFFKKTTAEPPAEGVWQPQKDTSTGKTYYWNPATGETSWDPEKELSREEETGKNK